MIRSHFWPSCSLKCQPDSSPASRVQCLDSQSIAYHQPMAALTCHQAKNHEETAWLSVAKLAFVGCKVLLIHLWSSISAKCDYWLTLSQRMQTGDSLGGIYF